MEKIGSKLAVDNKLGMMGLESYVGNCVGNKEKGSQNISSETLVFLAPLTVKSCNTLTFF